ncbi:MAG: TetR/AcrR family transcriptional regulator [Chloroflexota bacterium]
MNDSNDPLLITDNRSPTRADARRNREHLLTIAQELFAENGVETVSMTAIADTAGVGKGTLYRHFSNKVELCNALLDEDMRILQGKILQYMRERDDPLDKLTWFLEQILNFVLRRLFRSGSC